MPGWRVQCTLTWEGSNGSWEPFKRHFEPPRQRVRLVRNIAKNTETAGMPLLVFPTSSHVWKGSQVENRLEPEV